MLEVAVQSSAQKSWNRRMAENLAVDDKESIGVSGMECILEAAGEIKCVQLKVLLGRCLEIIEHSETSENPVITDDDTMKQIREAIK